jgi:trk system potassium uptake protein TrkH
MHLVSSNSNRSHVFVALGFVLCIILGTVLLGLPQAVVEGRLPLSLSEAFFTSTSAVCVTGLTVVSTAHDFSFLGQGILLALFQLGGLGVMTLAVLVFESLRQRVAGQSGELLESTLSDHVFRGNPRHTLSLVLGGTLLIEAVGFCFLYPALSQEPNPAWAALFLTVSAFCNAGFDNLQLGITPYAGNPTIGLTLSVLWLLGGFGFILPAAIRSWTKKETKRLDAAARMILWSGFALILLGPVLFWLTEANGGLLDSYSPSKQAVLSFFQGNTSRTAGFSMLDLSQARRITHAYWCRPGRHRRRHENHNTLDFPCCSCCSHSWPTKSDYLRKANPSRNRPAFHFDLFHDDRVMGRLDWPLGSIGFFGFL